MEPHDVFFLHSKKTEGVVFLQVVRRGEGNVAQVGQAADVVRLQPDFVELPAIEGNPLIAGRCDLLEPRQLEGAQFFPVHAFHGSVPDNVFHMRYFLFRDNKSILSDKALNYKKKPRSGLLFCRFWV